MEAMREPQLTWQSTDAEICAVHPYELFCHFPALSPFYTQIEKTFSGDAAAAWFLDNLQIPFTLVVVYLLALYFGTRYMKDKPAYDLKKPLAYWNLGLSIFSFIAITRCIPHLLYWLYHSGVTSTVCDRADAWFGNGVGSFWVAAFVLSKIPELFDTAFIVLRKRKLIFLHWYHHATVLLVCWYAGATKQSSGLYFITVNFSVHAVMYFYYFLAAVGIRVSWAPFVTTFQISQMFFGAGLCVYAEVVRLRGRNCAIEPICHLTTSLMYLSYLYLFVVFAWRRFGPKARKAAGKSAKPSATMPSGVAMTTAAASGSDAVKRRITTKGDPQDDAADANMLELGAAPTAATDDARPNPSGEYGGVDDIGAKKMRKD